MYIFSYEYGLLLIGGNNNSNQLSHKRPSMFVLPKTISFFGDTNLCYLL